MLLYHIVPLQFVVMNIQPIYSCLHVSSNGPEVSQDAPKIWYDIISDNKPFCTASDASLLMYKKYE